MSLRPAMVNIWKKASGRVAFFCLLMTYPNTIGPNSLRTNLSSVVYSNLRLLMLFSNSVGVFGNAAV